MKEEIMEGFELSPQQQHLWRLMQQHQDGYCVQWVLEFSGAVVSADLAAALRRVSARHEILRTALRGGRAESLPLQVILDRVEIPVREVDLRASESSLSCECEQERQRPFDYEAGEGVRCCLARLAGERHVLIITVSGLHGDLETMGQLVAELARHYEEAAATVDEEKRLQYAEVAQWQHELLTSAEGEKGKQYWRQQQAQQESRLAQEESSAGSRGIERAEWELEAKLAAGLRRVAAAHEAAVWEVLLASWQVLVWRLSGEQDGVIEVRVDGRKYELLAGVLGPLARYVPLRYHFERDYRFEEVLKGLKRTIDGASDWQEYFTSEDGVERRDQRIGFEHLRWPEIGGLNGLSGSVIAVHDWTDQFKLKLSWVENAGGGKILLSYDTGLYQRVSIERIGAEFKELLSNIVANPRELVSKLNLLSETEREQLLREWNQTTTYFPPLCLHELFADQARQRPEATALIYEDEQMSYGELERRANQLAHHLQRLGVGPEVLVGICLERTPQMIVALLAVLKAGGAYLPLDPAYPLERLSFMLEDARVKVLLTELSVVEQLPAHGGYTLCLDEEWERIASESEAAPECAAVPENLAYVMYTSGSTGQPKGVMTMHRNVVKLLWGVDYAHLDQEQTILQLAPISFDAATFEIWGALLHGAQLQLYPGRVPSVAELAAILKPGRHWTVHLTAALLNVVVDEQVQALSAVEQLLTGGEVVSVNHIRRLQQELPWVQLINGLGPTETTTFSLCYRLPGEVWATAESIPIGRPIANTEVYLLDEEWEPVPVGVRGELHVGGAGLARGYLRRAGLTAEKFLPDPFSGRAGARLYRSGDLGRYLADGNIEYRGRLDQQVKVRGYRIELGEIEAVLGQHTAVAQCVVNVWQTESGDKRLVGYVVWELGQETTVGELREYLSERLPEYMVPAQWVVLNQLPLTASGKLNRKALPAPEQSELTGEYVAPRTATEEIMVGIWAEVLGIEQVGIHDNFFELGGHSLLATQVIFRARDAFAVDLQLRSLLEGQTVSTLSHSVEQLRLAGTQSLTPPMVRRDGVDEIPLSFAQQRLWFLDQLEPNNPFYNIPTGVRLSGELNIGALERTLSEIVRRHEVLRTSFISVGGEPRQVISAATEIKLSIEDLSDLPLEKREQEAARRAREEAREPFNLSHGPLLRARLLRLAADEHVLLVTMHHIVSDGWSIGLLIDEVNALYEAYCAGTESPLPELTIQYADFAVWQREWLSGTVLEEQLNYWREQLRNLSALELPTDRVRPAVQSYRGATVGFALGQEETAALKELSRREGVTLFMVLLAAFQVLLSRYSGQTDVVVGTPIANRNREEIEDLIGFFVNTLALRVHLDGNPTFQQLLKRVREVCLKAYTHQDVPFEKLVEELQPERDLSRSPLFQVMFALQNAPGGTLEMGNLRLSSAGGQGQTSKYDLFLAFSESDAGLIGGLEYSTDLFDDNTILRLLEHFRHVLHAVTATPELPLTQISMLSVAEREQLLREWNETACYFPPVLVHELFAEQVRQQPEATALLYKDEQMSYGELERRANQLAHHLQRLGVGPEAVVGICLERRPQMVVALLAVLKAGGAYLPLDPTHPLERLSFMLKDAAVKVLLSQRELLEHLAPIVEHSFCLDEEWEQIAIESEAAPECAAVPENLAYVMYTSGSTGQPKGVMITQHSLLNYLCWARQTYHLNEGNGAPLHSSICFDLSVTSLYGPLLGGQCLELLAEGTQPGAELQQALEKQGDYSLVKLTPAHLPLLREQLAGVSLEASARRYILGGENLLWSEMQWWSEVAGESRFYNEYGPTETVVGCCVYEFTGAEAAGGSVPIGRPIANTELYVLDEELEPVPVGVSGEIYIGGAGLARGYLQRAGLTAEKFLPDPFSGRAGARLYRSGDLGRYLAEGNIEYRGRLDQQVKVRGFRIELGEIEAVLEQHAAVAQCVVNLRETESGDTRLVGYVVWEWDQESTVGELREYLSERLPEYMVPGQWVVLDDLPLTASGKVDRKALPAPEQSEYLGDQYVAPRTMTEEIMVGIWAEVLGVEQVGVHDNFFELGGHSLLATQVVSRARDAFAVELPLRNLLEGPTVSSLSRSIEQLRLADVQSVAPPLVPRDGTHDGEIPLSFAQQRLWFLDQLEPNNAFYNIPVGVRLSGELNIEALERTLSEIVRRHEVLRTSFSMVGGDARQVIDAAAEIRLPLEDLSSLPLEEREQETERRAAEEAREPFNLSRGPLLRARLLRLAADEHVLLVTMHHIVSDGWSMGVLVREVSVLYETYCAGAESPLPELAIQYADFAVWQRQWLSGDVLEEQLNYWREHLRGLSTLELPTDRVRPARPSYKGAIVAFNLDQEETAALKELSRREGATLFMVLLAAFQVLLSRYSGQSDIVVGTDVANRNRAETEGLIGFFVNQLVLRTELSGANSFVDVLQRVREVCLEAYDHQDVPFEKLVEELQPERDLSRSPIFQVKLIFQNAPGGTLQMGNLRLSSAGGQGRTANNDLLLFLTESRAGISGACSYSMDLFDASTIERLVEHFQQLLRAVAATPERPLTQISMLSAAEREQLLREWNQTSTYFPPVLVHELFSEQARQRPEATALLYNDEQMSYGELERRANQLARHLQRLGVGPEAVVGICLERRPQMVVALLAVLKAGGAYLPLDPTHPLERLSFMLEDAAVTVLLTESSVMERLPAHWGYTLSLDEEWEQIAIESEAAPECGAVPENLAYVMYTSGSTGQPKGVMITHHSLLNYLCWARDTYHLSEGIGAPLHSSICFDLSVTSLYGPLLGGQCLELLAEGTQPGAELQQALEKQGDYSLVKLTPAHLPLLREQLAGVSLEASARRYILGGENLLWREMQWWSEVAGESRFYNEYGPTETVVGCCVYEFTGAEAEGGSVPIGRPIANTELYVLDEELEPVPVGVSGEIYIGGAGLARGYLQRAGLTAEKFLPDPFSGRAGARLYRSGDLGRYLADGNMEYRGRLDQQVKVRGFRIELGEIEAVLEQHAAVAQCVVNLREMESGDKRLVGYVVWEWDQESTVGELREYLSERLPEYMVPGQWVVLDDLPLTASGKVDRKALPAPEQSELVSEHYVEPRTVTEEIMVGIWAEVLGVEQVGVHDNFFELGGHSLLATQLISRARDAFAVELPLRSLLEGPTVSSLSHIIEQLRLAGTQSVAPPIVPRDEVDEIPLSFGQQRLWFLDQLEPNNAFYNIPVGVRLSGELNIEALERTLSEIVRRHEVLRTSFISVGGEPRQMIDAAAEIKLPLEDLSPLPAEQREHEAERRAGEEAREPFDLSRGQLLRARLLRLAADEHVLLVTIHHIVSDGWSMGVLIREVSALYEAYCAGTESPLPELAIQYADFAVWQRQWLSGDVLEEQLSYWREQLRGLSTLELPTDRVRPVVPSYKGAIVGFTLGQEETAALKELSRREGATLFMVLLATFETLLHYYSKQDDIAVGVDIANRNQVEVEGLIGFFLNVLLLRSDLSGNPTFRELVRRVCETTLGAYAHQDLPFERLIEELRPERSSSGAPLVQVVFSFQNTPQAALKMSTLQLSPLWSSSNTTAKRDLTLFMAETGNGLAGTFSYDTDLFNAETIRRVSKLFEIIASKVVAQPDIQLNEILKILAAAESEQLVVDKKERRDSKLKQFMNVAPKALSLSQVDLIKTGHLTSAETMPLVVQPAMDDVDLTEWARRQRPFIDSWLSEYGAILFRGFSTESALDFEQVALSICPKLFSEYGDLPREGVSEKVYGATPYPADQAILFHNESSHLSRWPMKIWFFCMQAAQAGGETPIVDCRKVYELLDPGIRARFAEKKLMYVRNYIDGLDVSWQEFFRTTDKSIVEERCRKDSIVCEWKDGNGLRTRQICDAILKHPKTGHTVFFNQLQAHHVSCLEPATRASLSSLLKQEDLPRNVYYGDGSPIEDSVVDEIRSIYQKIAISFPWQNRDILMLDNMLTAHGRNAYTGERKIVVAMGEMVTKESFGARVQETTNAVAG